MKQAKGRVRKILFQACSFALAGIFTASVFLVDANSFSWFTASTSATGQVRAAGTWDILHHLKITPNHGLKRIIKIQKNPNFNGSPRISFLIEGELKEYITQINPIILTGNKEVHIPIVPKVTHDQYQSLLNSDINEISGQIIAIYLNDYIYESLDVSFEKNDLIDFYENGCSLSDEESSFLEIITFMASRFDWLDNDEDQQFTQSALRSSLSLAVQPESIQHGNLNNKQKTIIDIVAPDLISSLESSQQSNKALSAQLSEQDAKIKELEERIKQLEAEKASLSLVEAPLEKVPSIGAGGGNIVAPAAEEETQEPSDTASPGEESQEPSDASSPEEETQEPSDTASPEEESQEPSDATSPEEESRESSDTASPGEESQEPSDATSPEEESQEPSDTTSPEEESRELSDATSPEEESQEPSNASSPEEETKEPSDATSAEEKSQEPSDASSPEEETQEPSDTASPGEESQEPSETTSPEDSEQTPGDSKQASI